MTTLIYRVGSHLCVRPQKTERHIGYGFAITPLSLCDISPIRGIPFPTRDYNSTERQTIICIIKRAHVWETLRKEVSPNFLFLLKMTFSV